MAFIVFKQSPGIASKIPTGDTEKAIFAYGSVSELFWDQTAKSAFSILVCGLQVEKS